MWYTLALALVIVVAVPVTANAVGIDASGQAKAVAVDIAPPDTSAQVNELVVTAANNAGEIHAVKAVARPENAVACDKNGKHSVKILYPEYEEGTYSSVRTRIPESYQYSLCFLTMMSACTLLSYLVCYCIRRLVNKTVSFLEERFPELQGCFAGEFYPYIPIAGFLYRLVRVAQLIAVAWMLIGGKQMLRMLPMYKQGRPLPQWYWIIHDNPVPIIIFLFFLVYPILGEFDTQLRAFEIYLDDVRVFKWRGATRLRPEALTKAFVKAGMILVEPKKYDALERFEKALVEPTVVMEYNSLLFGRA